MCLYPALSFIFISDVIGTRRTSWRTLSDPNNPQFDEIVAEYRAQVEKELDAICAEVLDLLTSYLIKDDTSNDEAQVFYLKMAGDYFRYRAESVVGMDYAKQSALYYGKAYSKAQDSLKATHPIRLGLALNYSVCHYEILKNRKEACELAKKAFDMAIQELDELPEASYKDSTLIMQLLRDNLTLWTSGSQDEYEIDADDGVEVQDIGDEDL